MALVEAANQGDARAFERLYERHRDWMMGVAFRLTGDRDGAADVVQDAVLQWLRRFPGFTLTGQVRSYLYPVLRHGSIDLMRRRRRHSIAADVDSLGEAVGDAPPRSLADATDLDDAIARLPVGQREVLILHFGDRMTLAEVAIALEVPLGTVKSRLGLALASLRSNDRLRDRYFGE